ncbi:hypothetical protein ACWD4P_27630 [Kitasatospora sp. NPDC002543]
MNVRRKIAVLAMTAALAAGTAAMGSPASAAACGVQSDSRLHCGNSVGAKGYADRSYRSIVRGTLNTDYNWFVCWGHGEQNPGGNDIWYWTQLDNGAWGNVPASNVYTGQDPAPGLSQC